MYTCMALNLTVLPFKREEGRIYFLRYDDGDEAWQSAAFISELGEEDATQLRESAHVLYVTRVYQHGGVGGFKEYRRGVLQRVCL